MTAQELFILITNYEEQNSNRPLKTTSLSDCKKVVGRVSFSEQDFTKFVRKTYPRLPKDFESFIKGIGFISLKVENGKAFIYAVNPMLLLDTGILWESVSQSIEKNLV